MTDRRLPIADCRLSGALAACLCARCQQTFDQTCGGAVDVRRCGSFEEIVNVPGSCGDDGEMACEIYGRPGDARVSLDPRSPATVLSERARAIQRGYSARERIIAGVSQ